MGLINAHRVRRIRVACKSFVTTAVEFGREVLCVLLIYALVLGTTPMQLPNAFAAERRIPPYAMQRATPRVAPIQDVGGGTRDVSRQNLRLLSVEHGNENNRGALLASLVPHLPLASIHVPLPYAFQSGSPSGTSTISSNFNGTTIPAGSYVWLNSIVAVSGV